MSDRHIDIDELDDSTSARAGSVKNESDSRSNAGTKINTDEFDVGDEWQTGADRMETGFNFGNMFSNMSQQFRRWQGVMGENSFRVVPEETARHFRASQREFLLAWRSLIDYSLEQIDRREQREKVRAEADISREDFPQGVNKIMIEEIED